MNDKDKKKLLYEQRKKEGICVRCGKNSAEEGKFTCGECRNKQSVQSMEESDNPDQRVVFTHKVQIDNLISVDLKIPKIMTAVELKALTLKANKLLNLSESDFLNPHSSISHWSEEDDQYLRENHKDKVWGLVPAIAEKLNKTPQQVSSRINYLKKSGKWIQK